MTARGKQRPRNPLRLELEGVSENTPPPEISRRAEILSKLVRQARTQPSRTFGQKLRMSSTIAFTFPVHPDCGEETKKTKVITTAAHGIRVTCTGQYMSYDKPWQATVAKMEDILRAIRSYATFAESILRIERKIRDGDILAVATLPERHPSAFYGTYIKWIFGPRYRDVYRQLSEQRKAVARKLVVAQVLPPIAHEGETVQVIKQVTKTNSEEAQQAEHSENETLKSEDLDS